MNIQDIVVFMIVLLATAWMIRRIYRVLMSASGGKSIEACDHCPKNPGSGQQVQIIEIDSKPLDD